MLNNFVFDGTAMPGTGQLILAIPVWVGEISDV